MGKERKTQIIKDKKKIHDENIVRTISNNILNFLKKNGLNDKIIGTIYVYLHLLIMFFVGFIIIFNNNISHLCALLILGYLDMCSVVIFNGCPLTNLEKKYLKKTSNEKHTEFLKKSKIMYKCDHYYERQLELLFVCIVAIGLKILFIITFKTFNLKLNNYNNIFV